MGKREHIACILLFISLIMLVIPVIPHHHHADGLICMKNDITADCCGHQQDNGGDHCCCDTGSMTTHFFQQTPTPSDDVWLHPDTPWVVTLLLEPLSRWLILPEFDTSRQDCVYLESLHGTFITRATGLRAPPSFPAYPRRYRKIASQETGFPCRSGCGEAYVCNRIAISIS